MNILYLYTLVAVIASTLPVIFMKMYNIKKNNYLIIYSIISFIICIFAYYKILVKETDMSKIEPIIKITTLLLVSVIGIFLYDEKITPHKIIGLSLAIASIYFLILSK